ncbi:MAG: xylulokinase [Actinobacteria bacterium]|nr:xylulokinase [Actinomycetota bacterium]
MLIAHDLGTSGNKASLHSTDGACLATATASYPTRYAADTTSEQDPHDWWAAVVTTTHELLARTGTPGDRIEGICISGQMMGLVLLDADGVPLRPAMIWSDQRASAEAAELGARFGEDAAYRITGNRIAAPYTLPKLMWVRAHDPAAYERATAICAAKDYVNLRLTGRLATDRSDASHTGAYDLATGAWSPGLLDAAGVDAALWPEVLEATDVLGTLTPQAADELGLRAGTRVVTGGGDGPMAAVAAGCVTPDSPGYVCLGTSAWYACTTTAPLLDPERRTFNLGHVVPGLWTPTATTQTGAGSLQWAAQAFGDAPAEVSELIAAAAGVVAAEEDLFFLPYLIGERTPWWDPAASGVFVGLRMHHRRPHLTRAVLEGVGYSLALCMAPLRAGTAATGAVDVIGGGAASDTWLSLLADIWGVPVRRRSVTSQANSLGAAVTGLVGLGFAEFSLAPTLSTVEAEFEPGADAGAQPARLARFADAYRALRPWFAREAVR